MINNNIQQTPPNELTAWNADFSYSYLKKLYSKIRNQYRISLFHEAQSLFLETSKLAFIRHDLDVSLQRALPLAIAENEWGIVSTYHVMMTSPFYKINKPESRDMISQIQSLGHEVGLHYDIEARGMKNAPPTVRERDIIQCCNELEDIIGTNVHSVSFHLPIQDLFNGPLNVGGRINAYAAPLFKWYLSDSRARWREGDPIKSIDNPRSNILQILIHPIWWGFETLRPEIRLRNFLIEISKDIPKTYSELSNIMFDHIIFRAEDDL